MLSDDITGTVSKGIGMVGAVIGGGIRGAILGGAVLLGGVALFAAGIAFLGASGFVAGIGLAAGAAIHAIGGVIGSAIALGTHSSLAAAAGAGAAVIGVGSVIPGASEWFGLKGLLTPRPSSSRDVPSTALEPERSRVRPVTFGDNELYKSGHGAAELARRDVAQNAVLGR